MLQKYPTATEQDRTGKLFCDAGVATLIGLINRVGTDTVERLSIDMQQVRIDSLAGEDNWQNVGTNSRRS
jgi:hypothetical protein